MRVLVTFAVEAEFAPWRRLRNLEARNVGDYTLYEAQIGRAAVQFVVTGMGQENARKGASEGLSSPQDICIAAGFAGALNPAFKVGDVVVASAVQQLGKSKMLECSRSLARAAWGSDAKRGKLFLTADTVVASAEEKKKLSPFADAVDMESFATIATARERNVSAVAIRVISDTFDQDMPAEIDTTVDEFGRVKIGGVVKHIATHPLQLPALIRLGRQTRTAAEALAHFLEAFIKDLSFRSHGWPPPELQEIAAR